MPSIPYATKCAYLGCKGTRSKYNTYCLEHGGRDVLTHTQRRKDANAMYQTNAWHIMRTAQLSTQPLCQACLIDGHITQADHVDHLFRWQAIGRGAFYNNILQSLCVAHHSHKTGLEAQGVYEHYTTQGVRQYRLNDYESLMDRQMTPLPPEPPKT